MVTLEENACFFAGTILYDRLRHHWPLSKVMNSSDFVCAQCHLQTHRDDEMTKQDKNETSRHYKIGLEPETLGKKRSQASVPQSDSPVSV